MNTLTTIEKQRLEDLFGMTSGYVLNFSDQTFAQFFRQHVGRNIYDQKYACNGTSKAKRLRAFWETEDDNSIGMALEGMLELWRYLNDKGKDGRAETAYGNSCKTVARLLGRDMGEVSEDEFLKKDFGSVSAKGLDLDPMVEAILDARINEAIECISAGAPLSAIFMCGSVLEGVLLAVALKNPVDFNRSTSSPKVKDTGKVKAFHDWTLANFIDVSHEVGLLRLDVKKFSHSLRDFRNYIHPYEQMASKFDPDKHTAEICLQVLKAALLGLKAKRGSTVSI